VYNEDALFQQTLSAIENQMHKRRTDEKSLPIVPSLSDFAERYRTGRCFTDIPETSVDDLLESLQVCQQTSLESVDRPPGQAEFAVMNDTRGLVQDPSAGFRIFTVAEAPVDFDADKVSKLPRRATQWQSAAIYYHMNLIVHVYLETVDLFVPRDYYHPLLRRCWGALKAMIEVCLSVMHCYIFTCDRLLIEPQQIITTMCEKNSEFQRQLKETPNEYSYYTIRDIPHQQYASLHHLPKLSSPIKGCHSCTITETHHKNVQEALHHLQDSHIANTVEAQPYSISQLAHWIVPQDGYIEDQNQAMISLLGVLSLSFEKLRSGAVDIRNGVANENSEKPSAYLLPRALVKTAEKMFQLIYVSSSSVEHMGFKNVKDHTNLLQFFGSAAGTALSEARHALLLMAHTGENQAEAINIRSTPETTMLGCFLHLSSRPLLDNLCALNLYREQLSSMVSAS
jgi:hypothetical protein